MKLNPFKRLKRRSSSSARWLKLETKQAIIGVVLLLGAFIALLSFFSAAGPIGNVMFAVLRRLFGYLAYVVPFAVIWLGIYFIRHHEESMPRLRVVGIALSIIGLLGIFHLVGISAEDAYQTALDSKGGGLLGFMLAFPLGKAFSPLAAILLFASAFSIGIFLTFNLSPSEVWAWITSFMPQRSEDDELQEDDDTEEEEEGSDDDTMPIFRVGRGKSSSAVDPNQLKLQEEQKQREDEQKQRVRQQLRFANRRYQSPSLDILHSSVGKPDSGNVEDNKEKIKNTLEKFGITVAMGKVSVGPTVTRYTMRPDDGVKLSRITALQNDLALALAAHPIRMEAPIPNTNLVGIEVPNKDVSLVRLRDLFTSKEYRQAQSPLALSLGKDVTGKSHIASIEGMPHLLIAGATGSGKSIFINTLLLSLLYRNSPALVRMILVDPKRVELSLYNGIPHLLTPVIIDPEKTINALKWAVKEMDRRYRVLSESGSRNIMSFNANNPEEAMPLIVIVIDELADLMATHARDVEGMIVRLAQMARAIGIHLVLATQRPSVNVITGLIKANIPARIAFNVASQVDSRTILDGAGAEKLLGSGDMLYLPGDQAKPIRLQGSFVSEEEVRQVVSDLKEKNPVDVEYDDEIVEPSREGGGSGVGGGAGDDVLFEDAKNVVLESGKASASLLQRRLRVGYARAARLLDMLEEQGIIGEQDGNKPRAILVQSKSEYSGSDVVVEEDVVVDDVHGSAEEKDRW